MNLVCMTQKDFAFWAPRSKSNYANDKEKANRLTSKEAQDIAENDFRRLLPDGLNTKDNFLYTIKDKETTVGYVWFCIRGLLDNQKAYLCDIIIEPNHRRKMFGRKAMILLEKEVKRLGLTEIGLHVFGFNEVAIKLYESLGYKVTDLVMSKKI